MNPAKKVFNCIIVDDDEIDRLMTVSLVRRYDFLNIIDISEFPEKALINAQNKQLDILFLDIETVPEEVDFKGLNPEKQLLFEQKTAYQRKDEYTAEEFYNRAGIWAEFGKIICISVGYFAYKNGERQFRIINIHFSFEGPRVIINPNLLTIITCCIVS